MQRDMTSFSEGIQTISSPNRSNKYQCQQSSSFQVSPSKLNGSSSINEDQMNNCSMSSPSKVMKNCSVFLTPSPCSSSYSEEMNNPIATENRLYLARLTLEYQELVDRYGLCLSHLQEAAEEAEILRQENATLRLLNKDLMKRLSILAENSLAQFQNRYLSSSAAAAAAASYPALSIINDFRSLSIGAHNGRNNLVSDIPVTSPTSVIATNNNNQVDPKRVSLPKSISIRSSGYLKLNQAAVNKAAASSRTIRVRVGTTPVLNPVHVAGNDKEGDDDQKPPLELDVYNQGMFKTELCNKWQETGACPYGEHCQFAHGINELRPIIRHPRYKTEVCRMVLSGDVCPYGHRCHFRHALTDEEKLMAAGHSSTGAYHYQS